MKPLNSIELSVTEAVSIVNQTLEFAYPSMTVVGELSNVRVSKNKWVYFDLKDEFARLSCFGTIYMLPGPIEDGLTVKVLLAPRLHPQFGFSGNIQALQLLGEGSIKKASDLLYLKLEKEGLFRAERKRVLPKVPATIALITGEESAALSDTLKVLRARWPLLTINYYPSLVQGIDAPEELVTALQRANADTTNQAVVITRGGGSVEDLAAFNDERVVRAVALSRIPTLVAIGHEKDLSLSELAADVRASTPSNAAELLVPDINEFRRSLERDSMQLNRQLKNVVRKQIESLELKSKQLTNDMRQKLQYQQEQLRASRTIIAAYNPRMILKRGYAIVRSFNNELIPTALQARQAQNVEIEFSDGSVSARVE